MPEYILDRLVYEFLKTICNIAVENRHYPIPFLSLVLVILHLELADTGTGTDASACACVGTGTDMFSGTDTVTVAFDIASAGTCIGTYCLCWY